MFRWRNFQEWQEAHDRYHAQSQAAASRHALVWTTEQRAALTALRDDYTVTHGLLSHAEMRRLSFVRWLRATRGAERN